MFITVVGCVVAFLVEMGRSTGTPSRAGAHVRIFTCFYCRLYPTE